MSDIGVIGVGARGPHRHSDIDETFLDLAADAVVAAVRDAGLDRTDIDGLVVNSGGPAGPDYDQLANFVGLDLRASLQSWAHGRFTASVIHQGALLVKEGLANAVACVYARRLQRDSVGGPGWKGWVEELRQGGGPHGENPRVGLTAPVGNAAMAARLYGNRYGTDPSALYGVVEAARRNAEHYDGALRPKPVSESEYLDNPFVVEPLRRWDCTPRTEGAACVVVGRIEDSPSPARGVRILGFDAIPAGPEEFIWSRPGLGMIQQTLVDRPGQDTTIFERAGISRDDVDVFFTYDAFSPLVWFALERFGYCAPGEAPEFVETQGIGFDGRLPTNTHGGSLAAGQLAGWLHMVEAVTQVRGEAGPRQVADAALVHYGTCFGDSLVFGR